MISIIIPVYNSEKYLVNCLNSVIYQDFDDIEIICINDASTDRSCSILHNYQNIDPRIHIIDLKKNMGLSHARNTGLDNATGEYILFVDSDDELENNAITNLYNGIVKQSDIAASIGGIHVEYETNEYLREGDTIHFEEKFSGIYNVTDQIVDNFFVCVWGILYKRSEIERIKIRFPQKLNFEDNYWHWCFFTSVSKINFINKKVYKYFRRKNSITANAFKNCSIKNSLDMLFIAEKICTFWEERATLKFHEKYALRLIESMFFSVLNLSQNFEKPYVIYQCALILRKFNFNLSENEILRNIKNGDIGFLFVDTKKVSQYKNFLKIKSIIDNFLPIGSLRRKIILGLSKKIYKTVLKK